MVLEAARKTLDKFGHWWVKQVLDHFLRDYLLGPIDSDCLRFSLLQGTLELKDLNLNTEALNAALKRQGLPFELVDGFVGYVFLKVPSWSQFLSGTTKVHLKKVDITCRVNEHIHLSREELIEKLVDSFSPTALAAGMYEQFLLRECVPKNEVDAGVAHCSAVIDQFIAQVEYVFDDVTVRLEADGLTTGDRYRTAIECHIKTMCLNSEILPNEPYLDQIGLRVVDSDKIFTISGLTMHTDVFTSVGRCRRRISEETEDPIEDLDESMCTNSSHSDAEMEFSSAPIKFLEAAKDVRVVVKTKNYDYRPIPNKGENFEEPRQTSVSIESDSINMFITPSQIGIIQKVFGLFSTPSMKFEMERNAAKEEAQKVVAYDPQREELLKKIDELFEANKETNTLSELSDLSGRKWLEDDGEKADQLKQIYKAILVKHKKEVNLDTEVSFKCDSLIVFVPNCDLLTIENVRLFGPNVVQQFRQTAHQFFVDIRKVANTKLFSDWTPQLDVAFGAAHLRILGSELSLKLVVPNASSRGSFSGSAVLRRANVRMCYPNEKTSVAVVEFERDEVDEEFSPDLSLAVLCEPTTNHLVNIDFDINGGLTELNLTVLMLMRNIFTARPFFADSASFPASPEKKPEKDAAQDARDDIRSPLVTLKCPNWKFFIQVPKGGTCQTEFGEEKFLIEFEGIGMSTPRDCPNIKLSVDFRKLSAYFCGADECNTRFMYAKSAGWDRVNVKLEFENESRSDSLVLPEETPNSWGSASAIYYENLFGAKEGPFAKRRAFSSCGFDGSLEINPPGDRNEMLSFHSKCDSMSSAKLTVNIPVIRVLLPEKETLNTMIERLAAVLDWNVELKSKTNLQVDAISPYKDTYLFFDAEEEMIGVVGENVYGDYTRSRLHKLNLRVNVDFAMIVCQTRNECGNGLVAMELKDTLFGAALGFHGSDDDFVYLSAKSIAVGDSNEESEIPRDMDSNTFGTWTAQMQQVQRSTSSLGGFLPDCHTAGDSLAFVIQSRRSRASEVKDVLLSAVLRNSELFVRSLVIGGNFWLKKLAELVNFEDSKATKGIETQLQLSCENVVLRYDHCLVNPTSNIQLRAACKNCHFNAQIIEDVEIFRALVTLDDCALFISENGFPDERFCVSKPHDFVQIASMDVAQMEAKLCVSAENEKKRPEEDDKLPYVDVVISNNCLRFFFCADSLRCLLKIGSEVSQRVLATVEPQDFVDPETAQEIYVNPDFAELVTEILEKECDQMEPQHNRESPSTSSSPVDLTDDCSELSEKEYCVVDEIPEAECRPTCRYVGSNSDGQVHVNLHHFPHPRQLKFNDHLYIKAYADVRFLLKDVTVQVYVFGGKDFAPEDPFERLDAAADAENDDVGDDDENSEVYVEEPAKSCRGGPQRDQTCCVLFDFRKVTFSQQLFPESGKKGAGESQRLCLGEVNAYDSVKGSSVKKLFQAYETETLPLCSDATNPRPLLEVAMAHRGEGANLLVIAQQAQIRAHKKTLDFLMSFVDGVGLLKGESATSLSSEGRPRRHSSLFFTKFSFSRDSQIRVTCEGFLTNYRSIVELPIHLRRVNAQGLVGYEKCIQVAVEAWLKDFKAMNVITHFAPVKPLFDITKGLRDLMTKPLEEMRNEKGRVMTGVQKGVQSLGRASVSTTHDLALVVHSAVESMAKKLLGSERVRRVKRRSDSFGSPRSAGHGLQNVIGGIQGLDAEDRTAPLSPFLAVFLPVFAASQVSGQIISGLRNQIGGGAESSQREDVDD